MGAFCRPTMNTIWHYHGGFLVGRVVDSELGVLGVGSLQVIDSYVFSISPETIHYFYAWQECKGGTAHVIDVVGTSVRGLMIAMLAVPDENHRPMYSAEDIKEFYFYHAPKIFPQIRLREALETGPKDLEKEMLNLNECFVM
ncbi:patatin-like protein [Tanacetum coccineum]